MSTKIIFDVFGVLLTSGLQSAGPKVSSLLDRPIKEITPVYERWEEIFDLGKISEYTFWRNVQRDLNSHVDWRELNFAVLNNYMKIPGAFELLEKCKKKINVYLLSNTRREWFEVLDRKFAITAGVERAFLSYEMGLRKPDSCCFRFVISELGSPPEELIFIDDRMENIIAARKLGIRTIHFTSSEIVESLLKDLCPSVFGI